MAQKPMWTAGDFVVTALWEKSALSTSTVPQTTANLADAAHRVAPTKSRMVLRQTPIVAEKIVRPALT